MTPTKSALIATGILAAAGALRLALAILYPLSPDECYYWLWSKHLDWCYYSKGPLVAWTIALGTFLGGDTNLGVRLFAVLLHVATGALLFLLARRLCGPRAALWTLATAMAVPIFAVGGMLMTIDPLSVFFWIAAAAALWEATRANRAAWWLLAGLCIGLGFLAKFTNAIQGLCAGLFLLLTPSGRRMLRTPGPWLAAGLSLALTLPFWTWNAANGWITFDHLKHRGSLDEPFRISPGEFLQFLTSQAAVISPLIWVAVAIAVAATCAALLRHKTWLAPGPGAPEAGEERLFLVTQSLPLFLFFALFGLNDSGQPNWTVPAYGPALVLAAAWWLPRIDASKAARAFAVAALALGAVMTLSLHDTRWMHRLPFLVEPHKADPLTRVRGWDQIAALLRDTEKTHGADFAIANHYQIAAALTWHTPERRTNVPDIVFSPHNPDMVQNQFDFWPTYTNRIGQAAIFVTTLKGTPSTLRAEFESVEKLGDPFWIQENGVTVERFRFYLCRGYRGAP